MDGIPGNCATVKTTVKNTANGKDVVVESNNAAIAPDSDAAKKYTKDVTTANGGTTDSLGEASPGTKCTVTGKKVKSAGVGYSRIRSCKLLERLNPIAVCLNKGGLSVRDVPGDQGKEIDTLVSTQSFFACGVAGDGQTWLLTQGDKHLKWGWFPAQFVYNTEGGVSEKATTPGVVHC